MFDLDDTGLRNRLTVTRGNIVSVDDSKLMQTVTFRGLTNELLTAERFQNYGETSVPKAPDDAAGAKAPEIVVAHIAGDRNHPVVIATDDRRYRMKNLKPGERASHDDQGQNVHIARDGINHTAKQHVMSATEGPKPLTTFELQDQLKGLGAHVEQLAHNLNGLFDVTSQFRQIVQQQIPAVQAVAPILNQDPTGLTKMTQAIAGKFPSYLQQHIQDALAKFLGSMIGGVGSVMGGQDTIIAALQAQIAGVLSANPIVSTVDGLVAELAALQASGSPAVVMQMAPVIQGLIASATASNPVVGQVAQLRAQLAALVSAAGPGLGFLAPQQRIPQGLTHSLRLAQ